MSRGGVGKRGRRGLTVVWLVVMLEREGVDLVEDSMLLWLAGDDTSRCTCVNASPPLREAQHVSMRIKKLLQSTAGNTQLQSRTGLRWSEGSEVMKTEVIMYQALADSIKSVIQSSVKERMVRGKDTFEISDRCKANCDKLPAFTYVMRAVLTKGV